MNYHAVALAAALAASCVVAVPGVALAGEGSVARQGAKIFVSSNGTTGSDCTIGYNDQARRVSYTAAHCGTSGSKVHLADAQGRVHPQPVGRLVRSTKFEAQQFSNDWAVIEWDPQVAVGGNPYGGELIAPGEVAVGDSVCFHGFATHGSRPKATCGTYVGGVGNSLFFDTPKESTFGDSGAPVFVPGKGTIGVLSGVSWVPDSAGRTLIALERASVPSDGKVLTNYEVSTFMERQWRTDPNRAAKFAGLEAESDVPGVVEEVAAVEAERKAELEDKADVVVPRAALSQGAIAAIVVGVLVAVGALVAATMGFHG